MDEKIKNPDKKNFPNSENNPLLLALVYYTIIYIPIISNINRRLVVDINSLNFPTEIKRREELGTVPAKRCHQNKVSGSIGFGESPHHDGD